MQKRSETTSQPQPAGTPSSAQRNALAREHEALVRKLAYRMAARLPHNIEADDLISSGMIGLLDAIERFDSSRGVSFRNYAELRIRGAMLDELRRQDWVPRSVRRDATVLGQATRHVEQQCGGAVNDDAVADHLGVTVGEYRERLENAMPITMVAFDDLGRPSAGESNGAARAVDVAAAGPQDALVMSRLRDALSGAIGTLPEKERSVLSLYYFEDMNLKEIGQIFGVSESRISQLRTSAIDDLRASFGRSAFEGPEESAAAQMARVA